MGVTAVTKHRFYPDPTSSLIPKNRAFPTPPDRLYFRYVRACHLQADPEEIVALYRLTECQPAVNNHQDAGQFI